MGRGEIMKKFSLITLIICLLLTLAACGQTEPSPSALPSASPSTEPSTSPSTEPTFKPSEEPSAEPSHSVPDTAGLEQTIAKKWAEEKLKEEYALDPYSMTRLEYDLIIAHSDTVPLNIDPPFLDTDWLLRVTGDDSLYEVVAFARKYDDDGYAVTVPTWRSGDSGAGVDIETAEALVAAMIARPELLPTSGDSYLDDEEHYPSVLCKIGEDKVLVYATAHTGGEYGSDYGVFAVVPIALAGAGYTGNPYEVIAVNYSGWQTLEG